MAIGSYAIDAWGCVMSQKMFLAVGGEVTVFLMGFMTNKAAVTTMDVFGRLSALATTVR